MRTPTQRFVIVLGMLALLAGLPMGAQAQLAGVPQFGGSEMTKIWSHIDYPVVTGRAQRSFYFGPSILLRCEEPYDESDGGKRPVAYLDKARLEENSPNAVTSSLLAKELISGQRQLGYNRFQGFAPAEVPVAGDPVVSEAPTYVSFARVASIDPSVNRVPRREGQLVTETINRAGVVGTDAQVGAYRVTLADYREELGHNIPNVVVDFFSQRGIVADILADGQVSYYEQTLLGEQWTDVMGLPVAEPYWARVPVGGQTKWVLIQPFERRVVTYTPDNDLAYRVEMGNIGQHYKTWRHPDGTCRE